MPLVLSKKHCGFAALLIAFLTLAALPVCGQETNPDSLFGVWKSLPKDDSRSFSEFIHHLLQQPGFQDSLDQFFINAAKQTSAEEAVLFVQAELAYDSLLKARRYEISRNRADRTLHDPQFYLNRFDTINNRLTELISRSYHMYAHRDMVVHPIHSLHIYHDNDVFNLFTENLDRDYTGGFRIELTTDRLKIPILRLRDGFKWLSYQSIFIGGEGYTPMAQITREELQAANVFFETNPNTGFLSDASLDSVSMYLQGFQESTDRPYASFQYFGRGKYRIHYRGKFRATNLTKIGFIGRNLAQDIQARIHQDVVANSPQILNWDRQIANGGRLAANVEGTIDMQLVSAHSAIFGEKFRSKLPACLNLYIPMEYAAGTVATYFGIGLAYTTQNFLRMNAFNDLSYDQAFVHLDRPTKSAPWCEKFCYGVRRIARHTNFTATVMARRVIHNAMLEGLGFRRPFEVDQLDSEAGSVYTLNEDQVTKNLFRANLKVNVRLKSMSLYFGQTLLLNREFVVNPDLLASAGNFQTPKIYGWGTIGANFYLYKRDRY